MDKSLHGWAERFDRINLENLRGRYDTDTVEDFRRIERMCLPTYHRIFVSPVRFLEKYEYYKQNFYYKAYYSQLYPQAIGLDKYNLMNFTDLADLIPFLEEHIKDHYDKYLLLISEFEENIYGGSIMSDGKIVLIDIISGLQNQISYGKGAKASCIVNGREISFSGETDLERNLFREVLDRISLYGTTEYKSYFSGYFEFAFTKSAVNNQLRLVFFDYKDNSRFYI